MGTKTKIEWCDHTMNPWWGCEKVHAGCKNCYAAALDARTGGGHWGSKSTRRLVRSSWAEPDLWNAAARKTGRKARVFCASMCDVFEDYSGPVVDQQGNPATDYRGVPWTLDLLRKRLWLIVERTTNLEWLFLTKRPENAWRMVPDRWRKDWPENIMVGTSVSDQETANKYVPRLLNVPGRRFLSVEPLVGVVDLRLGIYFLHGAPGVPPHASGTSLEGIEWVIVGGESGRGARPCDVRWIRRIVGQCRAARVPVFVKQLGARPVCRNDEVSDWLDQCGISLDDVDVAGVRMQGDPVRVRLLDAKGGDPADWPEDLRVREFPR